MRTDLQKENLQKVIDGLKNNTNRKLDMQLFAEFEKAAAKATQDHPCDSLCCIVGSGPSFGVPIDEKFKLSNDEPIRDIGYLDENWDWESYSKQAFGFNRTEEEYDEWMFCFSGNWTNSIPEAIARLELAQKDEIPESWGYDDRFTEEK